MTADNIFMCRKFHSVIFLSLLLFEQIAVYGGKFVTGLAILPPVDGQAMLVGNQHYLTFDGRAFDFSGKNASYTLMTDVDRNLTVNVVYDNQGQKTSIVTQTNGHTIKIGADMNVSLDNQVMAMPFQTADTSVVEVSNSVAVNARGFSLVHDFEYDFTVVDINGFYFGNISGMLGTFNNDPSDDFMAPTGQIQPSVESFAESWKTGTNSTTTENNMPFQPYQGSWSLGLLGCQKYLTGVTSVLLSCFNIVNPKPFNDMCVNDIKEHGGCQAVAAYIKMCNKHALINLNLPTVCEIKKIISPLAG